MEKTLAPFLYLMLSMVPMGVLMVLFELKKRFASKAKRVPVDYKLLRSPGESCQKKIEQLDDKLNDYLLFLFGFPPVFIIIYLSQKSRNDLFADRVLMWTLGIMASLTFGYIITQTLKICSFRKKYRLGFQGERAVGEQLNQLMCKGCRVFHDFPLKDNWNIDHIVVAPSGVYAVETKTRSKGASSSFQQSHEIVYDGKKLEFPFYTDSQSPAQAERQAKGLACFLKETMEESIFVKPILAFPGWYVIPKGTGNVMVVNPKMIENIVLTPDQRRFTDEQIKKIAQVLDKKCRDVEF